MNAKTVLFVTILNLAASLINAQTRKLENAEFKNEIIDQWWSFENKTSKKDCDMRILVVRKAGFELNCVNWTDGFLGNKCGYDLTLTDNFFELKAKACEKNQNPGYLYGYLGGNDNLFLLISKKQMAISAALLSEKDWLKFEKIKR